MVNTALRVGVLAALLASARVVDAQPAPQEPPPQQPYPQAPGQPYPQQPGQPYPQQPGQYPQQPGQPYPQQPGPYPDQGAQYPYPYPPPYAYPPQGPEEMDYSDGQRIPIGYTKVNRKRKGLIIGGAVTFGVLYLVPVTLAFSAGLDNSNDAPSWLYVPVAGPFMAAADESSNEGKFWLVNWGLAQGAGAIMLIVGLTNEKTMLVRNDQVSITPMTLPGATGLVASGRF